MAVSRLVRSGEAVAHTQKLMNKRVGKTAVALKKVRLNLYRQMATVLDDGMY